MQQLRIVRLAILLTLASAIYGQGGDLGICPGGLITNVDPKWVTIQPRFEIVTELIQDNELMEVSQTFTPERDAIIISSTEGPLKFYYDFITNEQFQVLQLVVGAQVLPQCLRQEITPDTQTSVFRPNSGLLKPSVLLGYDGRNRLNPHWGNQYVGDEDFRGYPTNKFKACFYMDDLKATVSVLYYVADPLKFHAGSRRNQSIILRMEVQLRTETGREEAYSYNVFRFAQNVGRREQRHSLETPEGAYCPNRTSTLKIPENLPERVSANSELMVPLAGASIISTHGLYDNEFEVTRFDIWMADPLGTSRWDHYSEIHDFSIGLRYRFNYSNSQCGVSALVPGSPDTVSVDGSSSLLELGSPQHFFLMDDVTYQYSGEKRCRNHIWCHVWIAEKQLPNKTVEYREWYWASRINDEILQEYIPIKLVVRGYGNNSALYSFEIHSFNFRRRPMTIFEVDFALAACYRAMGPSKGYNLAVLSFKVDNPHNYPVVENLNYLRLHIFEALAISLHVRPTRISNLIVDQESNNIVVTFTLLDAPPVTGPVEYPLKESSLDSVIERLNSTIDSNGLVFRARTGASTVRLRARAKSLNIPYKSVVETKISSGPTVTGLWIGFVIIGLLVGIIGGFIALGRLAK